MHPAVVLPFLLALTFASSNPTRTVAPLIVPRGETVEGEYIVKFKSKQRGGIDATSLDAIIGTLGVEPEFKFNNVFSGFSASLTPEKLDMLRQRQDVDYIEQNAVMTKVVSAAYVTQSPATWGISRLSHRYPGNNTYVYDSSAGSGTCVYILDTGIDIGHADFEGRAVWKANFVSGSKDDDLDGHGTHVAGTVGSKTWGVAKKTTLFAVKVLGDNGSGTTSGVIAGMDYVASDSHGEGSTCPKGTFANMSLGGRRSQAVNDAANSMVANGVFVSVAAGNSAADASNYSPASEPVVCTVGATNITDYMAAYSNYGAFVDIMGPGSNITSTWINATNNNGSLTLSGTSMSAPHVAGLAAYANGADPQAPNDPCALCKYLQAAAWQNILMNVPAGTVNLLTFNGNPNP